MLYSDTRLGIQGQTVSTNFQKVFKMHDRLFIGMSGLASDVQTLCVWLHRVGGVCLPRRPSPTPPHSPPSPPTVVVRSSQQLKYRLNLYKLREVRLRGGLRPRPFPACTPASAAYRSPRPRHARLFAGA